MPNFTAGTSFTDGVTNDVTAAKLNALVADAVPTSSLALASTSGTISNFTSSTATLLGAITGSTNVINIGSGQIYKDASGNVGVGTASPTNKLHIVNSGAGALALQTSAASSDQTQITFVGTTGNKWAIGNNAATGGTGTNFDIYDLAASANRLRIDSSGNVIISSNKSLISNGGGGIAANTSIGSSALASNTSGYYNTATGYTALYSNTSGYYNTATGYTALYSSTTGYNNTANGFQALYYNTTGANNTANGVAALQNNTTGSSNTASGFQALYSNTTGANNTASGYNAGYGVGTYSNTTGSNNTFIGNESVGASATASNVVTLGNGSIATLRCQVTSITSLSDKRDKKDIENLSAGLDFVGKLRPVSFVWNTRDKAKVNIPDAGFIAQELLDVQETTGITIPNLVSQENPEKLEAAYGTLIPVLVQAIKELKAKVELLEEKNK